MCLSVVLIEEAAMNSMNLCRMIVCKILPNVQMMKMIVLNLTVDFSNKEEARVRYFLTVLAPS